MKRRLYNYSSVALLVAVILLTVFSITGCSSGAARRDLYREIEGLVVQRDLDNAVAKLEGSKDKYYSNRDRVLYYLDIGMLYHYQGDYNQSNEYLTQAEQAMEELFTKSVSRGAASLLLNDNVLDYYGEDYEDIYVNIVKAVNFLNLGEFDNAFVEVRRVNDKLNLLEDKYRDLAKSYEKGEDAQAEFKTGTSNFHNSALARYLSMLIYRTEGNIDSAQIDYNTIQQGWKDQSHIYNFAQPELSSHLTQTDKAKLNFVSFVGKPPAKVAFIRRITTHDGAVTISGNEPVEFIDTIAWPVKAGYHFKFSLPFMGVRESLVAGARVYADDNMVGELSAIEDIGTIAVATFEVKAPIIYIKSVTRSIVKGLLAEAAKKEMNERVGGGLGGALLSLATDVAVDASEQADIRTSNFLPGKTFVGEIELDAGTYNIRIDYLDSFGGVLFSDYHNEKVVNNRKLNLVNSFYLQ